MIGKNVEMTGAEIAEMQTQLNEVWQQQPKLKDQLTKNVKHVEVQLDRVVRSAYMHGFFVGVNRRERDECDITHIKADHRENH